MRHRTWWALACIFGFVSVAGGAFGAHGLENMVSPKRLATWTVGTTYMQMHALAMLGLALACRHQPHRAFDVAGAFFAVGVALFSGSLWLLVLLDLPILGAITPLGGVCFLLGWSAALFGGWQAMRPPA